jgi:hypothetical protein
MTINLISSSIYLGILCLILEEPFLGFSNAGWLVLLIQAVVANFYGYRSVMPHNTCAPQGIFELRSNRFDCYFSLVILDEIITLQMIIRLFYFWESELHFIRKQFQ